MAHRLILHPPDLFYTLELGHALRHIIFTLEQDPWNYPRSVSSSLRFPEVHETQITMLNVGTNSDNTGDNVLTMRSRPIFTAWFLFSRLQGLISIGIPIGRSYLGGSQRITDRIQESIGSLYAGPSNATMKPIYGRATSGLRETVGVSGGKGSNGYQSKRSLCKGLETRPAHLCG